MNFCFQVLVDSVPRWSQDGSTIEGKGMSAMETSSEDDTPERIKAAILYATRIRPIKLIGTGFLIGVGFSVAAGISELIYMLFK